MHKNKFVRAFLEHNIPKLLNKVSNQHITNVLHPLVFVRHLTYNPHTQTVNGSFFTYSRKGKMLLILPIGFQEATGEYRNILFCLTFSTQVKKVVKNNYSSTCEDFLYWAFQHLAVSHILCNICMVKIGVGTWTTAPLENRCVQPCTISKKCKISKIFMKIRTLKDSSGLKMSLGED